MTTTLDFSDREAVMERAGYLNSMFGRLRPAWSFDSWSMRTLAEQVDAGQVSDYLRQRLTEEIPVAVVAMCITSPLFPAVRHCDGYGNIHLGHDSDYECGGCFGCRPEQAAVGWSIGAWIWSVATGAARAELEPGVRGMHALATVGAAIAAAGSPGRGVGTWLANTIAEWNAVRVGRWYRVAGRRGTAREHHGVEGEVAWLGESAGGPGGSGYRWRGGAYAGAPRAGLKVPGRTGLVYVPAGQLEPALEPEEVAAAKRTAEASKAVRARRAPFAGSKGDAAYVIDGPNAGNNGTVIWVGQSRGEARVGVKYGPGEKDVAWCSAVDVVLGLWTATVEIAGTPLPHESALSADAIDGGDSAARAVLADSLEARGYPGLAAAWRGPIPVAVLPYTAARRSRGGRRASAR